MERATQDDIGFVKRKRLSIHHPLGWEHRNLTGD
jgi:hypothetical protein